MYTCHVTRCVFGDTLQSTSIKQTSASSNSTAVLSQCSRPFILRSKIERHNSASVRGYYESKVRINSFISKGDTQLFAIIRFSKKYQRRSSEFSNSSHANYHLASLAIDEWWRENCLQEPVTRSTYTKLINNRFVSSTRRLDAFSSLKYLFS